MALVEKQQLIAQIAPPLDHLLATQLVGEFVSQERRYIQHDWEPAELDAGQFCEVLARIIYHQDSGNLNRAKSFAECISYIESEQVPHAIAPRRTALHLVRVLRTIYKFRSERGAVHISPTYSPNHMDARLIIENVRWAMNETLRVFWTGKDRECVARAIRELLQFDVPCVGVFEDVVLVQRTDLAPKRKSSSCSILGARPDFLGLNLVGMVAAQPRASLGRCNDWKTPIAERLFSSTPGGIASPIWVRDASGSSLLTSSSSSNLGHVPSVERSVDKDALDTSAHARDHWWRVVPLHHLGGHLKTGHLWTGQNRPPRSCRPRQKEIVDRCLLHVPVDHGSCRFLI